MSGSPPQLATGRSWLHAKRWLVILVTLAGLLFGSAMLLAIIPGSILSLAAKSVFFGLITFFFGVTAGAADIVTRYRDEPFLALATKPALGYLLLNGFIGLGSYALLLRYSSQIAPAVEGDLVLTSFLAAFGGMSLLRSKLFSYQAENGQEISFGPAFVLEQFLATLNATIDRLRSTERQKMVYEAVTPLGLDEADLDYALDYIEVSLLGFQQMSDEEKAGIKQAIDEYRTETQKAGWPTNLRMMAIGFAVLNITGEANFENVIGQLKKSLEKRKAESGDSPAGSSP